MADIAAPGGDGRTELSDEDRPGLIPTYIATRADLFDAEQRNIVSAVRRLHPTTGQLLDDKYLRDAHRAMFGGVWRWAGRYRTRETNIGIDPSGIASAVRSLVADAAVWVEHEPQRDELAVRFHHRLVQIHPFPNGNGRHGRIVTDLLLASLDAEPFSWGRGLVVSTDELRRRYRRALQRGDAGDLSELIEFCRS